MSIKPDKPSKPSKPKLPTPLEASQWAAYTQSFRKVRAGGGTKPRTLQHVTDRFCYCVECRKARGKYPKLKSERTSPPDSTT